MRGMFVDADGTFTGGVEQIGGYMGKQMVVTCDSCGIEMFGKNYYILGIQSIKCGKQKKMPSLYLCPNCMRETKLKIMFNSIGGDE